MLVSLIALLPVAMSSSAQPGLLSLWDLMLASLPYSQPHCHLQHTPALSSFGTNIMALESYTMSRLATLDPSFTAKPSSDRDSGLGPSARRNLGRCSSGADETESSRSNWIGGGYESLPEVSMFYPIERTSAIVSCCDPRAIAEKLTACLQRLSITTEFNVSETPLHAEALDYTKFRIRLYKNENVSNKGILVELQRVDGDAFSFIKHAQSILAPARGEVIDERKMTRNRSSLNYIPAPILSRHLEKSWQEDTNSAYIMRVEELIKKDRWDAVLLGIESLLLLTDQERSQVSLSAAEAVLSGGSRSVIKDFIHERIHRQHTAPYPKDGDFEHVLGNSLQTASGVRGAALLRSLPRSQESVGRSGIVDSLLRELCHADDRPHDAYHAARCLNTLLESEMNGALIERGLPDAVRVSLAVGQSRHSLLARECDAALAAMADAC